MASTKRPAPGVASKKPTKIIKLDFTDSIEVKVGDSLGFKPHAIFHVPRKLASARSTVLKNYTHKRLFSFNEHDPETFNVILQYWYTDVLVLDIEEYAKDAARKARLLVDMYCMAQELRDPRTQEVVMQRIYDELKKAQSPLASIQYIYNKTKDQDSPLRKVDIKLMTDGNAAAPPDNQTKDQAALHQFLVDLCNEGAVPRAMNILQSDQKDGVVPSEAQVSSTPSPAAATVSEDAKAIFDEKETKLILAALRSLKSGTLDVDYTRLQKNAGLKTFKTALNNWGLLKTKLKEATPGAFQ